ncbi:MAG: methyl-accepting chemotaxis protein [Azonexus sp.]|jgi:methyl-accepting chemotaxis protein|nr:methyl-accepting chemotaxis protein [Azonexus sp.]
MSSVRAKIFSIVAILTVGLLLMGGIAIVRMYSLGAQAEATVSRLGSVVTLVDTARSAQHHFKVQIQEWKNLLIRGGDPALYSKHLAAFEQEEKLAIERLDAIQKIAGELNVGAEIAPGPVLEALKELGATYRAALKANDPGRPGFTQAVDQAVRGKDRPVDEAIDALNKKANHLTDEIKVAATKEMTDEAAAARNILIVLLLVGAAIGVGASSLVANGVVKRIREVEAGMSRVQSTQDLTIKLAVSGNDEIAHMTIAFNTMIARFHDVIGHAFTSSQSVAMASGQISATAGKLHEASTSQGESVSASAAAIEQLTTSIAAMSSHAEHVRTLSSQSMEKTIAGTRRVEELVDEIHLIKENVEAIAKSVQAFVSATDTISGMTQQVKDIADQTNLLALNAAIEAARAGETGRGFAVVADEVRKLAEKSGASANEIEQVTQQIHSHSAQVSSAVDAGLSSLTACVGKAGEVKQALQQAKDDVANAATGIADITASVKEQEIASTGIAGNMEQIAQMTEETSASSEESSQAADALHRLAEELRQVVSRFKI